MSVRKRPGEWRKLIAAFESSGESAETFCRPRGLRPKTLLWWRWNLRRSDARKPAKESSIEMVAVQVRRADTVSKPSGGRMTISVADVEMHVEVGTDVVALVSELRARC